ncbi:MAG TPA: BlaI/MecI/CopY family transcriptional regulator [Acidobacteriota bacterium]|nr:BlaI/MecI/CopY family transcriptional regulator [Acidobacteriota bacterium]
MSKRRQLGDLSRRERQIMDAIYKTGRATAIDVMEMMPDAPGNATVRKLMRILEEKGYLRHERDGNKFVYFPTISEEKATASAVDHLLDTFFKGSTGRAVIALLNMSDDELSESERGMISELIERSKREGR